jgi:hypothetical protein
MNAVCWLELIASLAWMPVMVRVFSRLIRIWTAEVEAVAGPASRSVFLRRTSVLASQELISRQAGLPKRFVVQNQIKFTHKFLHSFFLPYDFI